MKYTWDDIFDRAINSACFEPELRAKDNAREQVRDFAIEHGYDDIENAECPEDRVETYCDMFGILFDETGNIVDEPQIANYVRTLVIEQCKPYKWKKDCEELISFRVGASKFTYDPENNSELKADFKEVAAIVPKDWLYALIKRTEFLPENTDEEVKNFLDNEYTYDDSEYWYDMAVKEEKIVAVDFV